MTSKQKNEIIGLLRKVPADTIWGIGITEALKDRDKIVPLIKQLKSQANDDYDTMASILGAELANKILNCVFGNIKDLTGQKFGRLKVVKREGSHDGNALWLCVCECGIERIVKSRTLIRGIAQSCGCGRLIHGLAGTPFYGVWASMKVRTKDYSKQPPSYKRKGIKVCERWREFQSFYDDMYPSYQPGLTLDRIDNNGNYEPGNCRWTTTYIQNRNKENSAYYTINGEAMILTDWCRKYNIHMATVFYRIKNGIDILSALTIRPRKGLRMEAMKQLNAL